ncbi:uncharacterized protein [Henckelia pumila]|uniref:uncharacterized protein isoform X2 n=1 Tax=Henckelia pumila TaxID=405737 RepID=UPI003C6DC985
MMSSPQQKIKISDDIDFSDNSLLIWIRATWNPAIRNSTIRSPQNPSLLQLQRLIDPSYWICVNWVIYVWSHLMMMEKRSMQESALKFCNNTKAKNFKLVKVCKINYGSTYFGVTRAQEEGSEECPLFRGAIHCVGGDKPAFCEIKQK